MRRPAATLLAFCAALWTSPAPAAISIYPEKQIAKGETAHEWPFSIDAGELSCIMMNGERFVFFFEPDPPSQTFPMQTGRSVVVTTNPIVLFATYEDRALYAPYDSLETLIKRLGPFEAMGRELCNQTPK